MVSQQIVDIIIKAQDQASATAKKVDDSIQKIGQTGNKLSRIPGFDAMKSKLSSLATTIDNKTGGAFTRLTSKISSAATTIRGRFSGAVDGVRAKLSSLANSAKKAESSFGFLRGAASMAAGMIGYDLVNSMVANTRASLNARSSLQAFAGRLKMSASEVSEYQKSLDSLQQTYKKIDMDVVGQQATDMAFRLGLPKTSLTELTETTAIFTDAMQRNGRSAEDSMLAMSDAMDGQFVRLKEIGITQEDLVRNGWNEDLNDKEGLLKAMNKALKEQHYDELAKSVDTLDEAWQVLSITMGNLLESILLPLTPAIVGIVNGITDAVTGVQKFLSGNGWAQGAVLVTALAVAFIFLAGSLVTAEGAFIGVEALMPGFIASLFGAASGFMAITIAGAPLWAIVAAVAAIAIAVYELGIALHWWSDVGSMLDAVWAGLQRLWSAFVNHPDVQAAIQAVSSALQTLWGYIQQAGQAIMEFFGIATGGEFDVVRAIIDGVGAAWEIFSGHLTAVVTVFTILISIFQAVGEAIGGFWNDTLLPFGEWLSGVFAPVWQLVADLLNAIEPFVSNLTNAFTLFANGQMSLPSLVWTVLTTLFNAYVTIFGLIMSRVTAWGISLLAKGVSVASNFVNNIVNWLRQLPGRALSALLQVVSSIVSAGSQWVSNATSQASSVVSGVVGRLSSLPGNIAGALGGVVDAIVSPFRQAYDAVVGVVDSIKNKVQEGLDAIGSLGGAMGSDHTEAGGDHFSAYGNDILPNATEYSVGSGSVEVSGEVTERLILDFQNVPSHIDTNQLIEVMQDRRVLESIARNRDFQSIDTKVKSEIIGKSKRYYGV